MALWLGAACLGACSGNGGKKSVAGGMESDTLLMLVGSYAEAEEEGIKVYGLNQETGETVYRSGWKGIRNPSFLTVSSDLKRVYSVGENEEKTSTANALAFDPETGQLSFLNESRTDGAAPCYIVLSPNEDYVVTANYTGGSITVFPVDETGRLGEGEVIAFEGKGQDAERQEQPHLHCAYFTPDGRFLLANDLGTDCIHAFPADASGEGLVDRLAAFDIRLAPGSGPRHSVFDAGGKHLYLIDELKGDVVVMEYDGTSFTQVQSIQADTVGARGSADIHLSPDGKFLYASNRLRADGLAIFAVDAANGQLTKVGYQLTGAHPRNFAITPNGKFVLVACRDTNEIEVYARNAETGLLTDTGRRIRQSKPVVIALCSK